MSDDVAALHGAATRRAVAHARRRPSGHRLREAVTAVLAVRAVTRYNSNDCHSGVVATVVLVCAMHYVC